MTHGMNAIEILTADRDEWKRRALEAVEKKRRGSDYAGERIAEMEKQLAHVGAFAAGMSLSDFQAVRGLAPRLLEILNGSPASVSVAPVPCTHAYDLVYRCRHCGEPEPRHCLPAVPRREAYDPKERLGFTPEQLAEISALPPVAPEPVIDADTAAWMNAPMGPQRPSEARTRTCENPSTCREGTVFRLVGDGIETRFCVTCDQRYETRAVEKPRPNEVRKCVFRGCPNAVGPGEAGCESCIVLFRAELQKVQDAEHEDDTPPATTGAGPWAPPPLAGPNAAWLACDTCGWRHDDGECPPLEKHRSWEQRAREAERVIAELGRSRTDNPPLALTELRTELGKRAKPWCSSRTWEAGHREGLESAIKIVERCTETARPETKGTDK